MSCNLSSSEFNLLQKFIKTYCGIQLSEDKAYFLENRLVRLLEEAGVKNYLDLYYKLVNNRYPGLINKFIDAITIKETRWFRDEIPWQILAHILLPQYLQEFRSGERTVIRIWNAACSTGQESYSTAMTIDNYLREHSITRPALANFEILATDVSQTALAAAQQGIYDSITIQRGLEGSWRQKYFTVQPDKSWKISEQIRKAVSYRQYNLCNPVPQWGQFDIIFCRYVTLYFYEELKQQVLARLASALKPGGILFLGTTERFFRHEELFSLESYGSFSYYRRLNNL